jgi:hypothetical protein
MAAIKWANEPSEDDLDDAALYLDLIGHIGEWGSVTHTWLAKDLLRAARLTALSRDNAGVRKYLERFKKGETISPVLIVRGSLGSNVPLTIAEGYHRVSAAYHLDEKTEVHCRMSE